MLRRTEHLEAHGTPQTPADLSEHACFVYNQRTAQSSWVFKRGGEQQRVDVSGPIHSSNGLFLSQLAERGKGIVIQPDFIAEEALKSWALAPVLSEYTIEEIGVYALYPSRQYLPEQTKRFIDHLKAVLGS